MEKVELQVKTVDNYVDFKDKNSDTSVKGMIYELLRVHVDTWYHADLLQTIKLKTNEVNFLDGIWAFGLFASGDVVKEFLSVDTTSIFLQDTDLPFLFTVEVDLSIQKQISTRAVYNVFDFASDIGGLQGALAAIFIFICGFYSPAMFSRSVMRHNFKYDSNTEEQDETTLERLNSKTVSNEGQNVNSKAKDLAERLRKQEEFQL